ncbi:hypothetical protein [Salinisphaera sp. Q1T1-3]|uniref:hypothetical protein n=1 Tax=Salinisphaera sp. Q1T1-3 TaxID=2321229 RepID=UPI000E723153|nr:hypothetical protein [Salinisphaera sp. Q1T1-3]RJS92258.1 hypothetical protein D3260_12795 [Salinisphaera sp. Q1T1-3]
MSRTDSVSITVIGNTALALVIVAGLGGCAHLAPAPQPPVQTATARPAPTLDLLRYARRLSDTTPAGRETAVDDARQQVRKAPGATTYAHLALALAAPHQRLYTPDEAARYARLALNAAPNPWDDNARQYLGDMARWLTLATQHTDADADRIRTLESQLGEARTKLEALSDIEQRIDDNGDSP